MGETEHPEGSTPRGPEGAPGGRLKLVGLCLAVFAIVAAAGLRWAHEHRLAAECRRRLLLLGEAARKYAGAYGGSYPHGPRAIEDLLVRYLRHRKFAVCPKSGRTYAWTGIPRRRGDAAHLLLAWEKYPHGLVAKRYHALFVGGRVKAIRREELQELIRQEASEPPKPRPPRKPRPGLREPPDAPPPGYIPKLPPGVELPPLPGEERKEEPRPEKSGRPPAEKGK